MQPETVFDVTLEDVATLKDEEFEGVWSALGTAVRARATRLKKERVLVGYLDKLVSMLGDVSAEEVRIALMDRIEGHLGNLLTDAATKEETNQC